MQKYSVLMSVYINDIPEYVKLAIDSMLNQSIKPEQYVIVQDGPVNEEISNLLAKYEEDYPNIFTIITLEENRGLACALNEGLLHCRNELIARMDADDISLSDRCEKILENFEKKSNLTLCGCNIKEFYGECENVKTLRVVPSEYEEIKLFMRRRQPFNHPTVIYKKSKVLEIGGYSPLKRKEDFDLFSRMLIQGYEALNIDEALYLYRANENNYLRRKSFINLKSALLVYKKHFMRHGCSWFDFLIMCCGELFFFILPTPIMKFMSDKLLREKV